MMENAILIIPFISGVYMTAFALWNHTRNFLSAMLYKIIPFFLGLGCMYSGAKLMGWL